jgi:hypothetical protein
MGIMIPEGEVCFMCKRVFDIGSRVTVVVSDLHRGGKVHFHTECWKEYCKKGGGILDFLEPLNNPRYPI